MFLAKYLYKKNYIPVSAVFVKKNCEIAYGFNFFCFNFFSHAESISLRQCIFYSMNHRLDDVVLYVTVKPCVSCIRLLRLYKIKKIIFGLNFLHLNNYKFYKQCNITSFIKQDYYLFKYSALLMNIFFKTKRLY